jgi:hypothetical protein
MFPTLDFVYGSTNQKTLHFKLHDRVSASLRNRLELRDPGDADEWRHDQVPGTWLAFSL